MDLTIKVFPLDKRDQIIAESFVLLTTTDRPKSDHKKMIHDAFARAEASLLRELGLDTSILVGAIEEMDNPRLTNVRNVL